MVSFPFPQVVRFLLCPSWATAQLLTLASGLDDISLRSALSISVSGTAEAYPGRTSGNRQLLLPLAGRYLGFVLLVLFLRGEGRAYCSGANIARAIYCGDD